MDTILPLSFPAFFLKASNFLCIHDTIAPRRCQTPYFFGFSPMLPPSSTSFSVFPQGAKIFSLFPVFCSLQ
ncbi:hypothetical protein DW094_03615 [Ruminococcaceae bacterium AM07-15]|nr:hypothetical protein DW094_03615 [Ruminococcaceae bacterium AM07-15]